MKRALACALVGLAACDAGGAYLYTAHKYDPARNCLSDLFGIDVEPGTDPGATCGAKCLTGDAATSLIYVTTMCGPPPQAGDTSGSNPACPAALAAFDRNDFCLDGGGSTNPLDGSSDAGTD